MGKFQFKDYSRTLEFPSCSFTILCNSDTGDKIRAYSPEMKSLNDDYNKGLVKKDKLVEYVMSRINDILGDGAASAIFEGRQATLSDATDVMLFIINEVNEANKSKATEALNQISASAADIPEK